MQCASRIPANGGLERDAVEKLTRPVGRPSQKLVVRYKGLLSIPSSKLEDGAAGSSEGGVQVGGNVLPSRIHRCQPGDGQSGLWSVSRTSEARQSKGSKKANRR